MNNGILFWYLQMHFINDLGFKKKRNFFKILQFILVWIKEHFEIPILLFKCTLGASMNFIIYWSVQSDSLRKVKGYQVKTYLGISLNVCYSLNRLELLLCHTNT